jgi:hypothetical protein
MAVARVLKFGFLPYGVDVFITHDEVESIHDQKQLAGILAGAWATLFALGPFAAPAFGLINYFAFKSFKETDKEGGEKGVIVRIAIGARGWFNLNPFKPNFIRFMISSEAYPDGLPDEFLNVNKATSLR